MIIVMETTMRVLFTLQFLFLSLSPQADNLKFKELAVKAIPSGSTMIFQRDLFIPANFERVELNSHFELSCFLEIHPTSNRSRIIKKGSVMDIISSAENPPRVELETVRKTLISFGCEAKPETLKAAAGSEFYFRYAERMNLNYSLSIDRFEEAFQKLFQIHYSKPIEIESNESTLRSIERTEVPKTQEPKVPPLLPAPLIPKNQLSPLS